MRKAIEDLVDTLRGIDWLDVVIGPRETVARRYMLTVELGDRIASRHFGAANVIQEVVVTLHVPGRPDYAEVATRIADIEDAVLADRRRDSNAQTTVISQWERVESDDNHVTLESTIEVHAHES